MSCMTHDFEVQNMPGEKAGRELDFLLHFHHPYSAILL